MDYSLGDLFDLDQLKTMLGGLNGSCPASFTVVDSAGAVLAAAGWQDVCVNYHKQHPKCLETCASDDRYILNRLSAANPAVVYRCLHGFVNAAMPIVIDGVRLGNLVAGPFFLDEPDLAFFRAQAEKSGFDESGYLAAVRQVLVCDRKKMDSHLLFLRGLLDLLSGAGLRTLRVLESEHRIESGGRLSRAMFENAPVGIAQTNPATAQFLRVNPQYCEITGYSAEELLKLGVTDITHPDDREEDMKLFRQVIAGESPGYRIEKRYVRKDGSLVWANVNMTALRSDGGEATHTLAFIEDITERKQLESEREARLSILRLINSTSDLHGLIKEVTALLQQWTGCEAVGVRLRDGDDFPYYETRGFSGEFVEMENSLCQRGLNGEILRDATAAPVLECMCGNILCGRFDPRKPFFTRQGSFWTSSTSALLASTTESDWQGRSRNRCTGEGYESVALIPLRAQGQTFGLLQLNDRRSGQFTGEKVAVLERMAASLSVSLAQRQALASLQESERRYRSLFNGMAEGFAHCRMLFENGEGRDFIYLEVNHAFETLTGLKDVVGRKVSEVIPGIRESDPGIFELYGRVSLTGLSERCEWHLKTLDMWFSISVYSPAREHFVAIFDVITERKRAEEELRQTNLRLNLAAASGTLGIWEWEIPTDTLIWNDRMYELYGLTRGQFSNCYDAWKMGLHPDDRARAEDAIAAALRDERRYDLEFRVVRPDGSIRHIKADAIVLRDETGPVRMIGLNRDVTEARLAEDALREAVQFNQQMLDSAREGVIVYDRDLRYQVWNRFMEELSGVPAGDVIGRRPLELFPVLKGTGVVERVEKVLSGAGTSRLDFPYVTPDRSQARWVSNVSSPLRNAAGEIVGVIATVRDITTEVQSEEYQKTLFREMQNGAALHEIICDARGVPVDYRFLAVNPAFERMTGLRADDVVGKTAREVLPNLEPQWIETYGKVALTGNPISFEEYSADLARRFEVAAFRPAANQFACILSDITERKLAEEERARFQLELAQIRKMESIGRLAGGVAHDFNNLLTAINGYAEMALMDPDICPSVREHVEEIRKAGERAAGLTSQLLAFSRKQILQPKVLDLNRVVEEFRSILLRLVGEHVRVNVTLSGETPAVRADRHQLEQVIMNLAVNARDAMPVGGTLQMETAVVSMQGKQVEGSPGKGGDGHYAVLIVRDSGKGMDDAIKQHIFEPFFTTKESGDGTGLGLSMVQGIVAQSGGHIDVQSEPGKGTTFRVFLPLVRAQSPGTQEENKPDAAALRGGESILVVEDQKEVRKLTAAALRQFGYTVVEAADASEALSVCRRKGARFDLVLSDVVMPNMSGPQMMEIMKPIIPGARFLFMSGYTDDMIVRHGIQDESIRFIQKPFKPQALARKIREVLED